VVLSVVALNGCILSMEFVKFSLHVIDG
jgi:hypothetical protein